MLLSQTNPNELVQFLGYTGRDLTTIGLLFVGGVVLGYLLYKCNKERIKEAKEYNERLEKIGSKFMEQTNKMMLFIELSKSRNNGS